MIETYIIKTDNRIINNTQEDSVPNNIVAGRILFFEKLENGHKIKIDKRKARKIVKSSALVNPKFSNNEWTTTLWYPTRILPTRQITKLTNQITNIWAKKFQ